MKNITLAILAVAGVMGISTSAQAISHQHRQALIWSGCTQSNEGSTCDIHKPREWNLRHSHDHLTPPPSHGHHGPSTSYKSEIRAFMDDSVLGQRTDDAYQALQGYGFVNTDPGIWLKGATVIKLRIAHDRVVSGSVSD